MLALIDCNNFFVSCERLFRPDLENRPVVVLSSNDGCAVSRSREAKELGIPMGAPAFKYKDLFNKHGVVSLSANFELYGDVSQRLVALLTCITPHIEVYSVDESFLDLSELGISDYTKWGEWLRERIFNEVGVPVSIGIANSKTLCKLANHRAKKVEQLGGVLAITDPSDPEDTRHYLETPVQDLWGVGWRLAPRLKAEGVHNAEDMRNLYKPRARQLMGVHGAQMVAELQGISCLPLEQTSAPHQTIMRGRTLGREVRDIKALKAAVATLTARAAFCLRKDGLLASSASLVINTNKHKPGYQRLSQTVRFAQPTADTGALCNALAMLLTDIHRPQIAIYRVNVYLHDLVPAGALKLDLFGNVSPVRHDKAMARMAAFDAINARFGRGRIKPAAEDLSQEWQPRKGSCSPRYTTKWTDLPIARLQLNS
jgi:DNA polymerase V